MASRFRSRRDFSLVQSEAYGALPKLNWEEQGCLLTFSPIPKGHQYRGQPGARPIGMVGPMEMRELRTHDDIRAAIEGKATKYGNLDRPLIVAVNVLDDFCDDGDIRNALFGDEQLVFIRQPDGHYSHEWGRRAGNGAWLGRNPRNTLVSAVSITHNLSPSTLRSTAVRLIHNPWAMNPLAMGVLRIPQTTISLPDGQLHQHDGTHHADLLAIPDPWPVPD